jgi:DNA ligase-1
MTNQLVEGIPQYVQGSGRKPYECKNSGGIYSCSCPAWRNQSRPIEHRTCKHLMSILGAEEEAIRTTYVVVATATPEREAEIMARAAGRKLRPDEKAKLNGPPVMLAHSYDGVSDVTGWWCSEKLDGVRAYWNGKDFISRQGNVFHAPAWFKEGLPSHPLDGELWMGRQKFQQTIGVVKRLDGGDLWKDILYVVYDVPHLKCGFEERLLQARLVKPTNTPYARILKQEPLTGLADLETRLRAVTAAGAEGLMIRAPGSLYETGRSHTMLKVKMFHDAEATVVGYEPGKGRHKGRIGALVVRMPNANGQRGAEFSLGTGMSDAERTTPPQLGTIVTYRYTELTQGGIPKCASFLRVRVEE